MSGERLSEDRLGEYAAMLHAASVKVLRLQGERHRMISADWVAPLIAEVRSQRAELARLRPVVEAARAYRDETRRVDRDVKAGNYTPGIRGHYADHRIVKRRALLAAVDALGAPAEDACSTCGGSGFERTLGMDNDEIIEDCPACSPDAGGSDG